MENYFQEITRIEALGYDTVIQYCHPDPKGEYEGGHVMHITKPSGQSVAWAKAESKSAAIEDCLMVFKNKYGKIS